MQPVCRWLDIVDTPPRGLDTSLVGIHVLGAFETDEGPLSPRERAVLSVLTLRHGHPIAPDAIADALWGDDPPSTWTKQVQAAMARIRTRLGRSAITTTSIWYRLR